VSNAETKEVLAAGTLGALRRSAVVRLRAAGIASPELDVRALLRHAFRIDDASLIAAPDRPVSRKELNCFEGYLRRRMSGEPIARMSGSREFWSRTFRLGPDTLVPRPES
jgi:release factor glutamine methyltransferase